MLELLSDSQLRHLESAFRIGASDASQAMAVWLSAPSLITIESVSQMPIGEATSLLAETGDVVCFCGMSMAGSLTGHLILCFDDASGHSLADLLTGQPVGTSSVWGEVETSAALESHNIIGCAYLNSLATHLPGKDDPSLELIPSPPNFQRDFAQALLESVFMSQAEAGDLIFVAKSKFELNDRPLNWTLLFVPDSPSIAELRKLLPKESA